MDAFVLRVDRDAEEPVYVQIARQVREAIASGLLEPGTGLPPVRSLASDLGVNLNTVARAYRLLEEEGFVQVREREGAVVAPPAGALLGPLGRGSAPSCASSSRGCARRTAEVLQLLEAANARGTTVVVATHDRALLSRHKKRVIALEGGRVAADGAQLRPAAG